MIEVKSTIAELKVLVVFQLMMLLEQSDFHFSKGGDAVNNII